MSVTIRLSRMGSKHHPFYRIVAATTKSKRDGKNIEMVGSYIPKEKKVSIDKKKFEDWVKKGAIVSQGVKKILGSK